MSGIFHTLLYDPLYNALVFLVSVVPGGDVGVAIVILTVAVKLIIFPLSLKAVRTNLLMRTLDPKIKEIRERLKTNKEAQAKEMMALYRAERVNPLSSIFLILIQLPIIFALYLVFFRGGFPDIHTELLYSFIQVPERISTLFVGLIDVTKQNIPLALLAGVTQFFQAKLAMPTLPKRAEKASFGEDFQRSFQVNIKYGLPVIVAFISYTLFSAVALYWVTSNLFAIGQELYVRKRVKPNLEQKNGERQAKNTTSA